MGLEHWTFDFSRRDDELLAKHSVLHQQLGPRASDIGKKTSKNGKWTACFPNRCSNRFNIWPAADRRCRMMRANTMLVLLR